VHKSGKALLYNTETIENIHTQNVQVINLIEQMHEKKNLGVIGIDEITHNQPDIEAFIKESVAKNICTITKKVEGEPKPFHLMPILNLQKDIEKLKKEDGRSFGEDIFQYLSDITVYLNNSCNINCANCENYITQFFFFFLLHNAENIYFEFLKQLFSQLGSTFIRRLAITGGNVFLYPHLQELVAFLKKEEIAPIFGLHYGNIDLNKIALLSDFSTELFVTFPLEDNFVQNITALSKQENVKVVFEITSEMITSKPKN
jgi:pseudo-rSAM protein